jgi:hypothetical protein
LEKLAQKKCIWLIANEVPWGTNSVK